MNFWKRLRLIGSLVVLGIGVLAVLVVLLNRPTSDEEATSDRSHPTLKSPSGTTGL
jgi:hypothetical protein